MHFIGIFFIELILLFVLSRFVTGNISNFMYRLTKSSKWSVYTLAFLFLPGTIIHELSHFFMAQILFVRTGEIEFVPKVFEDRVKLGSVQVEKTDPFRRALIGVAPFLLGTSLMLLIFFSAELYNSWGSLWMSIVILYVIFEIGNTMFSSQKDMEGVIELFAVIIILGVILYFMGIRIPQSFFDFISSKEVINVFEKGSYYLIIPIVLDLLIIGVAKVLLNILKK